MDVKDLKMFLELESGIERLNLRLITVDGKFVIKKNELEFSERMNTVEDCLHFVKGCLFVLYSKNQNDFFKKGE